MPNEPTAAELLDASHGRWKHIVEEPEPPHRCDPPKEDLPPVGSVWQCSCGKDFVVEVLRTRRVLHPAPVFFDPTPEG